MIKREINQFRRALEDQLESLGVPPSKANGLAVETTADAIEDAQSRSLRELAVHVMNADWRARRAIEAALERIETGAYGECENCGEPINSRRLTAVPWAPKCVACQQETEDNLVAEASSQR